ncbi:MAG: BREX-1 system adenine-specific DNA-methyltransferase PglX [Bacteroidetes bacterium]|nr:BREX-1 system adenine-specific DNA-methyltransferase PglX [Bacteroidota bacterium]
MNTNTLKRFAKDARIKLLDLVGRKMEYVLSQDTAELRGKVEQIENLRKQIKLHGQSQVIEIVAYTWFNRFMALRFMDANGYTNPKIVTPAPGSSIPEILQEAKAGNIDAQLQFDRKRFNDLLDGKTSVVDAQTEAYKLLLIATCNYWNTAMPFMFEKISDYTELLLPDDLISDFSIITDIRNGMTDEDCKQEELIGWLYQFYIADKKDEVFAGLAKNQKITPENIPAATQLFTPRWIVRYMVENTLGKLWMTFKPDSKLREHMPYYIENPEGNEQAPLPEGITGVGDIRFLDPCLGSGHVLVYAFELFSKIYEEEGYDKNLIPSFILGQNLIGIDIDQRATQLAAFALTMKARSYYYSFLKKSMFPQVIDLENISEEIIKESLSLPITVNGKNIYDYRDLSLFLLTEVENFGSLIQIYPEEIDAIHIHNGSIFERQQEKLKHQVEFLSRKYHCVVTNPPYMGSKGMNDQLRRFIEEHYNRSKADLMTCFMERCGAFILNNCSYGMINLPSWLFLSSFQKLRKEILSNFHIESLLHMGRGIFGIDFGSTAFIISKNKSNKKGVYFRLHQRNFQHIYFHHIEQLFLRANANQFFKYDFKKYRDDDRILRIPIESNDNGVKLFYLSNQRDFENIPGSPIGYWLSNAFLEAFKNGRRLEEYYEKITKGSYTGDNSRFIRYWFEINSQSSDWLRYNKAGGSRKWYGLAMHLISLKNDLISFKGSGLGPFKYFNKPHFSWSGLTSGSPAFRLEENNVGFDDVNPSIISDTLYMNHLGFLNSNVAEIILQLLNPTLHYQIGDIKSVPILQADTFDDSIVLNNIEISKEDWDSRETSWNFARNELVKYNAKALKLTFEKYKLYWTTQFSKMCNNDEKINSHFIDIYGLKDELKPEVQKEKITILQEEAIIIDGELSIEPLPVLLQFLSYSIGCIFGRYSLDSPGLILANLKETVQDYLKKIPNPSFSPDEDNIIPFLEGEYFTDDVVDRFKEFIKVAFGLDHFEENIKFIEDTIGKDIRKYFIKDFYNDHIKRYKKRPIYWMFSSPKGSFKALIYMHRYRSDTVSKLLNDYLRTYIAKLESEKQSFTQATISESASARERTLATKRITEIESILKELKEYERTLYELAMQKIEIDLDDGVKVNYQKFKSVLVPIKGLEKEEE